MKSKLVLLFFYSSFALIAQNSQYPDIDISYKKYVLENGLTLIVHEDHKVPNASFNIWYHVGSKNEKPGKTGFAHLFEHIMFTSTEHWNNFDEVLQTVGGANNNGTTNTDRTNYFETFTSAGLDRVLWVEADRMGFLLNGLSLDKINVQRGVVQNEKRQGDNQPYSVSEELTVKSTYPVGHPYSWTVIGSMDDLNAATLDDVKQWFKTYYGPNNAIISIAGDVKSDEVYNKVKKYFGEIPASPPISKHINWVSKMTGYHSQIVQDRVPQARIQKTWNIPGWGSKEATDLELLSEVLTSGKSSRLYKRLVIDEDLVTDVSCYVDSREIGSQFNISASAKPGADLFKIDKIINEELQKVFDGGITQKEIERAKTSYFVGVIQSLERSGGFGGTSDILAESETYGGRPDFYKQIHKNVKEASIDQVKFTSKEWLSDGEYNLQILPYSDYTISDSKLNRETMPEVLGSPLAKFPEVQEFSLSNGLKVYLAERHDVPSVIINTELNAGISADPFNKSGVCNLTGNMMMEGTVTKSSTEISDALLDLGTQIFVGSDLDFTKVYMRTLKSNFNESLDLYADILQHPSFPDNEYKRLQKEQIIEIKQEKSNPSSLGLRILPSLLYPPGHAYRVTSSGTEESVKSLTREDLMKFHETWFVPNNAFMAVSGDITLPELKLLLEKSLSRWKKATIIVKKAEKPILANKTSIYIIDKPDADQSRIYAAQICPPSVNSENEANTLMNTLLGGSFLSRLNMNLREDKHWSYGAGSYIVNAKSSDVFVAAAGVQTDKTKESISEMLKELTIINTTKQISESEFKNELNGTLLSIANNWETLGSINFFLSDMIEHNRGKDYGSTYSTTIKNLTLQNIQKSAQKLVSTDHLVWLVIGDRTKIEKGIRELNLGEVKILDNNGNEIK